MGKMITLWSQGHFRSKEVIWGYSRRRLNLTFSSAKRLQRLIESHNSKIISKGKNHITYEVERKSNDVL